MNVPLRAVTDTAPPTPREGGMAMAARLALAGLLAGLLALALALWGARAWLGDDLRARYADSLQSLGAAMAQVTEAELRAAATAAHRTAKGLSEGASSEGVAEAAPFALDTRCDGGGGEKSAAAPALVDGTLSIAATTLELRLTVMRTLPQGRCRVTVTLPADRLLRPLRAAAREREFALVAADTTLILATGKYKTGEILAVRDPATVTALEPLSRGQPHALLGDERAFFFFPVVVTEGAQPLSLVLIAGAATLDSWWPPLSMAIVGAAVFVLLGALLAITRIAARRIDEPLDRVDAVLRGINAALSQPAMPVRSGMDAVVASLEVIGGRVQAWIRDRRNSQAAVRNCLQGLETDLEDAQHVVREQSETASRLASSVVAASHALRRLEAQGRAMGADGDRLLAALATLEDLSRTQGQHLQEIEVLSHNIGPVQDSLERIAEISRMLAATGSQGEVAATMRQSALGLAREVSHLANRLGLTCVNATRVGDEGRATVAQIAQAVSTLAVRLQDWTNALGTLSNPLDAAGATLVAGSERLAGVSNSLSGAEAAQQDALRQLQQGPSRLPSALSLERWDEHK